MKDKTVYWFCGISITLVVLTYIYKKNKSQTQSYLPFKDSRMNGYVNGLHPKFRPIMSKFINKIESPAYGSLTVLPVSGTRSFAKQAQLASGGGDTHSNVSLHNFGFAMDINIFGKDKHGREIDLHQTSPTNDWSEYVNLAKDLGMTWGGTFTNTPTPDRVHFSYGGESNAKNYLALYNEGKKDSKGFVTV